MIWKSIIRYKLSNAINNIRTWHDRMLSDMELLDQVISVAKLSRMVCPFPWPGQRGGMTRLPIIFLTSPCNLFPDRSLMK